MFSKQAHAILEPEMLQKLDEFALFGNVLFWAEILPLVWTLY